MCAAKKSLFVVSTKAHEKWMFDVAELVAREHGCGVSVAYHPGSTYDGSESQLPAFAWDGLGFSAIWQQDSSSLSSRSRSGVPGVLMRLLFPVATIFFGLAIFLRPLARKRSFADATPSGLSTLQAVLRHSLRFVGDAVCCFPVPKNKAGYWALWVFFGAFWPLVRLRLIHQAMIRFLVSREFDSIVLPEANILYEHAAIIAAARDARVKVIVLPYTLCGHKEWVEAFARNSEYHRSGLLKRLVAYAYPEWTYNHKGLQLTIPTEHVIGSLMLDVRPEVPWCTNSIQGIIVGAEDELVRSFYAREGCDTSGWRIVGSLAQDRMFLLFCNRSRARGNLLKMGDVKVADGLIVIAMPPDQFHGAYDQQEVDGASLYLDLAKRIASEVKSAAGANWNVIICPHPRTNVSIFKSLVDDQTKLATQPIDALIPLADIYVAVSSATIKWAICCSVPVVNFDAYGYSYDDYLDYEGVIHAKDFEGVFSSVHRLVNDKAFYLGAVQCQAQASAELCGFDGKSSARILQLFDEPVFECGKLGQEQLQNGD